MDSGARPHQKSTAQRNNAAHDRNGDCCSWIPHCERDAGCADIALASPWAFAAPCRVCRRRPALRPCALCYVRPIPALTGMGSSQESSCEPQDKSARHHRVKYG
eukprot:6151604-Pleurochrysis_carterae.AAC.1